MVWWNEVTELLVSYLPAKINRRLSCNVGFSGVTPSANQTKR